MRAVVVAAALLAGVAAAAAAPKPWFCHGLDCPEYTVLETTDAYEVREYAPGKWVSTDIEGYLYSASQVQGFQRLFNYISGDNDANAKINMTAPVVTKIVAGDGPFCKSNFTVSFFVPFSEQDDTPLPTNPNVYLHSTPGSTFYVSQFGGFLVDDITLSAKAGALAKKLKEDGADFVDHLVFSAGYDPPFRLTQRHNEIWLLKSKGHAASHAGTISSALASQLRELALTLG